MDIIIVIIYFSENIGCVIAGFQGVLVVIFNHRSLICNFVAVNDVAVVIVNIFIGNGIIVCDIVTFIIKFFEVVTCISVQGAEFIMSIEYINIFTGGNVAN